ncbi:hypothetical protein CIW83_01810 [Tissierella sp. P1]|uniref:hypothetical protein n=1 Tax=Tissierella sp. P1 TaxID=1280483 RepID=UPI000BA10DC9|nr:hypothetical protein [Tissierella sp. P1]OZV13702.1 hypothetical protein CIW83_01810 [Tissierella sp. P1]
MKNRILLIILSITIVLIGCTPKNSVNVDLEEKIQEKDTKISELEDKINELESQLNNVNQPMSNNNLLSIVVDVMDSIKNKDMDRLSSYVHPTKGLRFSPYGHIDTESSQVFTVEEVKNLKEDNKAYLWGHYDGSGEPIKLNFNDYYKRFVYDKDFANPQIIGNDISIGEGNTVDNIKDVYPNSHFVEFYFKGFDPQYAGIDWRSLKLVFEEENGKMYLIAIAHGEWTI